MGILENTLISVGAGLSAQGFYPFMHTIAPFITERSFEQIKLDIDQQNVNVKLVGYADYPTLGPTHAEIDAIHLMKLFKTIRSFFPKNGDETEAFIKQAYFMNSPAFISLKSDPFLDRSITKS